MLPRTQRILTISIVLFATSTASANKASGEQLAARVRDPMERFGNGLVPARAPDDNFTTMVTLSLQLAI